MNQPTVSIILPTYNREKFLPEAFAAIAAQAFTDWELIVVDDGSTDGTRELVPRLTADFAQPVRYIYQENQGAYGARNTGLDHATGKYIAFYDSDDLWLPHHLHDCVAALDANPDVDWVYGACRMVDHATGEELAASTFYVDGKPRPFLELKTRTNGPLSIIDDAHAIECSVSKGMYAGLQNSVIRSPLFEAYRFSVDPPNEGEDVITTILALAQGRVLAYFDHQHVEYRVHDSNSSATKQSSDASKVLRVMVPYVRRLEWVLENVFLPRNAARALRRNISGLYVWHLGYTLHVHGGESAQANAMLRRGISYDPWRLRYWKTYCAVNLRRILSRLRSPLAPSSSEK